MKLEIPVELSFVELSLFIISGSLLFFNYKKQSDNQQSDNQQSDNPFYIDDDESNELINQYYYHKFDNPFYIDDDESNKLINQYYQTLLK